MGSSLDITVLPIYRQEGHDQSYLPGLHVAIPPRRAARGRRLDRLILFASFEGGIKVSSEQYDQLLKTLAQEYYKTPGTVTSALRLLAETLNDYLLKRNLSGSGRGRQVQGLLTLIVFREGHVYMAQSGAVHGFLLKAAQIRHLYDAQAAGRGLGLGRNTQVRFFQAEISPGDLLIVTPKLPGGWNENTLKNAHGQQLGTVSRRLLIDAGTDLTSVLLLARVGKGQITLLKSAESFVEPKEEKKPQQPAPLRPPIQAPAKPAQHQPRSVEVPARPDPSQAVSPPPKAHPRADEIPSRPGLIEPPVSSPPTPQPRPRRPSPSLGPAVVNTGQRVAQLSKQVSRSVGSFLSRMLPGESTLSLSTSNLIFIAVAVPMVVVTIAVLVYLRIGRQEQYQAFYSQAYSVAEYALTIEDPLDVRAAWETTLFYLDKADLNRKTTESQSLREHAQSALDQIDGVIRLDFQPAINGTLGRSVEITRMVVSNNDLYMLNAADGSVMRAWLTGYGYEIDPDFRCGPGKYGAYIIEQLVDIDAMPRGNDLKAAIVAIDSNGIVLYCLPDEPPLAFQLVTPDSNWGAPQAISVANGNLYVLDPVTNAVWIYFGEDGAFGGAPRFFFANEVPSMQRIVDLVVNGDDLYLLHDEGHMVLCAFSDIPEAPTTCTDPAIYADNRPGRSRAPLVYGAHFTQLVRTDPPEPSIYYLDPIHQSVYHFSLRLNLARQFRSITPLPSGQVTAFTVSPTRSLFVAVGSQVFVAFLP
ncbi:MAG: hypothetical protein OEZ02_00435 [Anaerolineae bacterium]|nr:hypothetical protein [Anaerolineae bacterium]